MEVTGMQTKQTKLITAILLALSSTATTVANAQSRLTGFSGSAELQLSHDDNIYRTTDEFAQSDTLVTLTPQAKLVGALGKHQFQINYNGSYAKHFDLEDADFDDHSISVRADLDHTYRLKTRIEAAYISDHQEPGSINRVQLDLAEFNKYDEVRYSASIFYGGTESTGRLEFKLKNADIDYTNNALDFLDNTLNEFTAKFIYRLSDKTSTYVEAIYGDYDYTPPDGSIDQDNSNTIYRAGISWNFANKLTGDINAGYQDREFDNQSTRSTSGLTYNGNLTWDVSETTEITVTASRQALDSTLNELGSFTRNTLGTSLKHQFTEYLTFEAKARYFKDNIDLGTARNDDRYSYSAILTYQVSSKVSVSGSFKHQSRDSSFSLAEYESNIASLYVKVAIQILKENKMPMHEQKTLIKQLWLFAFTSILLSSLCINLVMAQDLAQYRLSADDVISVTVFNESDLSLKNARVSSTGTIAMPLIGQVTVKGLTLTEVEQEIHRMYLGDYLKKPDISVSIVEYRQFYVNGEVDKPGGFSYREGMTVERAIALAGGFSGRAARDKIFIVRENTDNNPISAKLTTLIRPGDVITVQESFFQREH